MYIFNFILLWIIRQTKVFTGDRRTTEIYARTDTELKRKALEKAYPDVVLADLPQWNQDEDLLVWLSNL
jgi:integrase/recombinase XerD